MLLLLAVQITPQTVYSAYAYYRHAAKLKMLCLEGSRSFCGGRGCYANSIERE
jgi:hypothetical protein